MKHKKPAPLKKHQRPKAEVPAEPAAGPEMGHPIMEYPVITQSIKPDPDAPTGKNDQASSAAEPPAAKRRTAKAEDAPRSEVRYRRGITTS